MGQDEFETLLNFFKALGNESRLKIIGILANRECTVSELAAMLDLKEPTVSQHLFFLKHVGLVDVRPDGNHRYYSFNSQGLHNLNKDVFSRENLAALVQPFDEVGDAWERKVLSTYFHEGKLTQFPSSDKKWNVILKWLTQYFEEGVQYTEKQVNEILTRFNEDYATLRRDLVDYKYMQREKGIYWKLSAVPESQQ
ncbi:MAG: metalloregulator ArsR/SmtB family transcription factor [Anaerolineae bacterium]